MVAVSALCGLFHLREIAAASAHAERDHRHRDAALVVPVDIFAVGVGVVIRRCLKVIERVAVRDEDDVLSVHIDGSKRSACAVDGGREHRSAAARAVLALAQMADGVADGLFLGDGQHRHFLDRGSAETHDAAVVAVAERVERLFCALEGGFESALAHGTRAVNDQHDRDGRGVVDRLHGEHLLKKRACEVLAVVGMGDGIAVRADVVLAADRQHAAAEVVHIFIQRLIEAFGHAGSFEIGVGDVDENHLLIGAQLFCGCGYRGDVVVNVHDAHGVVFGQDALKLRRLAHMVFQNEDVLKDRDIETGLKDVVLCHEIVAALDRNQKIVHPRRLEDVGDGERLFALLQGEGEGLICELLVREGDGDVGRLLDGALHREGEVDRLPEHHAIGRQARARELDLAVLFIGEADGVDLDARRGDDLRRCKRVFVRFEPVGEKDDFGGLGIGELLCRKLEGGGDVGRARVGRLCAEILAVRLARVIGERRGIDGLEPEGHDADLVVFAADVDDRLNVIIPCIRLLGAAVRCVHHDEQFVLAVGDGIGEGDPCDERHAKGHAQRVQNDGDDAVARPAELLGKAQEGDERQ